MMNCHSKVVDSLSSVSQKDILTWKISTIHHLCFVVDAITPIIKN